MSVQVHVRPTFLYWHVGPLQLDPYLSPWSFKILPVPILLNSKNPSPILLQRTLYGFQVLFLYHS